MATFCARSLVGCSFGLFLLIGLWAPLDAFGEGVFGALLLGGGFYGVRLTALQARHRDLLVLADARARALHENARLLEEIKEHRGRFERLLQIVPGVVWEAYGQPDDASQRIEFVSAHIEPMLGYSVREWLDTPNFWLKIVHPEDKARVAREAAAIFAAGSGLSQFRWIARDGRTIGVEARSSVIYDEAGVPIGMVGITTDISDRLALEAQFRQSQKMEAVGQLAGGIAHDFNNLLTAIIGNSDLLSLGAASAPSFQESLGEIRTAADRAAGLTRQLLAFSRRQILDPTVLDLGEVVTKTVGLLRRLIGEDVDLSTVIGHGSGYVRADRGQIEQVIMNLAVNARDAMPMGGKLTIETAALQLDQPYASRHLDIAPGSYIVLAVTDTGHGMDAATQARIFEPFFTTKEVGKGTGLGLATAYGIVKQSGGHILVYSEPGHGTTFKVYLPHVDGQPEGCAEEAVQPPAPARGTETVLLVEDEVGVRSLARTILSRRGYRVLEASNAEQAITIARDYRDPIELLLTDCVMPGGSGAEVAEQLASSRPDAKVLFMSGYTDHAALRHGVVRSGSAFLQKPFTVAALASIVRRVLDAPAELRHI